jgi:basic amino acid/polyamine antiporter, APA family
VIFFAYIGFDAVSTVAEETRNPKRDLPIGIFASLAICTLLYVIVSAVFIGLIPYSELVTRQATEKAEPLTLALSYVAQAHSSGVNTQFANTLVAFGSVVAVLLVFQLGQPRIFFSMARDGLLPPIFARVHPRYKTPHVTTIVTGLVVGLIAGVTTIDEMVDLTNIGTLFAFILVCAGIPILRYKDRTGQAGDAGGFRVPLGAWLLPSLGVASCAFLMFYLPPTSWWRFVGWLMLGLGAYSSYGFTHSTVGRTLGRPSETPGRLSLAAVGFFLAGLGLIILPHELGLSGIASALVAPGEHTRAAVTGWMTLAGLALGIVGWMPYLRSSPPPDLSR